MIIAPSCPFLTFSLLQFWLVSSLSLSILCFGFWCSVPDRRKGKSTKMAMTWGNGICLSWLSASASVWKPNRCLYELHRRRGRRWCFFSYTSHWNTQLRLHQLIRYVQKCSMIDTLFFLNICPHEFFCPRNVILYDVLKRQPQGAFGDHSKEMCCVQNVALLGKRHVAMRGTGFLIDRVSREPWF